VKEKAKVGLEPTKEEKLENMKTKSRVDNLAWKGFFKERVRTNALNNGFVIDKHGIINDGRGVS
jgi:hypothetical protein